MSRYSCLVTRVSNTFFFYVIRFYMFQGLITSCDNTATISIRGEQAAAEINAFWLLRLLLRVGNEGRARCCLHSILTIIRFMPDKGSYSELSFFSICSYITRG